MNRSPWAVALVIAAITSPAIAKEKPDPLCAPLRAFVESVKLDEHREFAFHTIWGGDFKDSTAPNNVAVVFAKRCTYNDYVPAKPACDYLMANGVIEFAWNNANRALACLAPETRFPRNFRLNSADILLEYGDEKNGSFVELKFENDDELGGQVLQIAVDG